MTIQAARARSLRAGQLRDVRQACSECHPVNLAQPDRAVPRGQPSTHTAAGLAGLCPRGTVW